MKQRVIVIGAGGHAAVVADALLVCGMEVLGFTESDLRRHNSRYCGLPVLGDDEQVLSAHEPETILLANGVGGVQSTELRCKLQTRLESRGWRFATVRHPSSIVSPLAQIEEGVQLLAGSVIQPCAVIGKGSIVNTGAVVEHDVNIGKYVHVAPRALLCGFVKVGSYSHVGAGAVVRQGVNLGEDTVVGAGAVVVKSFPGGGVLIGVPARLAERAI
jgi:sugar O-acyltransferase (sialic acid O-acetyltransferase NeuD family)